MFEKVIRYCFYLLFLVVPLAFLPNTSELFEFNKIIVTYALTTIILGAWIGRMLAEGKFIFRKSLLDWPLVLFLGIQLVSLFFSIDGHTSLYGYYSRWNGGFLSLASYALLYWAFVANISSERALKALKWAMGSAVVVCAWGIMEHFGVDKHLWVQDVQNRVFSTLGQPNWLAAYIVAIVWIPLSKLQNLSTKTDKPLLWLWGSIFVALFTTLLYTKSRSGLLAFAFSAAVYWGLQILKHKKHSATLGLFGFFTAITCVFTIITPNPLRDLVVKSSTPVPVGPALEVGGTESGNIRKIVWTGAVRIWQANTKNLLIGTGPETFAMAYYQFRPIEHNATSEWELLYNKAHNEFLNYLATTGILGLGSYLLILGVMLWLLIQPVWAGIQKTGKDIPNWPLHVALLAGWLTIPITNFWGFSVVLVQLLLFLLPALAVTLQHSPQKNSERASVGAWIVLVIVAGVGLIWIARYWLADIKLASSQKNDKYFQATQKPEYLGLAHQEATAAYNLNRNEPAIASQLSNTAAYLAFALATSSTESAQQLANLSVAASDQALKISPYHPNYYKSRARSFILMSDMNEGFLPAAADALENAMLISPTDPRLPFNLGVIYKYLGKNEEAKGMWEKSLQLKPDFADPKKQLEELSS